MPLIAAGVGVDGLYASFAMTSDLAGFSICVSLGALDSALQRSAAGAGSRRSAVPAPRRGEHYVWLFASWACVIAGLLIPPYASS